MKSHKGNFKKERKYFFTYNTICPKVFVKMKLKKRLEKTCENEGVDKEEFNEGV